MCNQTYYETMAEYNYWMNQKLYAICAEIPAPFLNAVVEVES
jgi:uncharacterized damage-inducible protein DinB